MTAVQLERPDFLSAAVWAWPFDGQIVETHRPATKTMILSDRKGPVAAVCALQPNEHGLEPGRFYLLDCEAFCRLRDQHDACRWSWAPWHLDYLSIKLAPSFWCPELGLVPLSFAWTPAQDSKLLDSWTLKDWQRMPSVVHTIQIACDKTPAETRLYSVCGRIAELKRRITARRAHVIWALQTAATALGVEFWPRWPCAVLHLILVAAGFYDL